MRILKVVANNFGSYKYLEFDFDNQGLSLISGPTGSGKSTLCDLIPWSIFGTTAKGGLADDVISWNAEGLTSVTVWLDYCTITRVRGAKNNDLYYNLPREGIQRRGKDLADTQKLINSLLGLNADLYLSGAYFHEFSAASTFFIANAKLRRQITEQMVDLTLAKTLTERTSEYKKSIKAELVEIKNNLKNKQDKLKYLNDALDDAETRQGLWESEQKRKIDKVKKLYENFELDKAAKLEDLKAQFEETKAEYEGQIQELEKQVRPYEYFAEAQKKLNAAVLACSDEKCETCGNVKNNTSRLLLSRKQQELDNAATNNNMLIRNVANLQQTLNKHLDPNRSFVLITANNLRISVNTYAEQLKRLKAETNPHNSTIATITKSIDDTILEIGSLEKDLEDFQVELSDVELLVDVIAAFRAELIKNAIIDLETNTNKLLTEHFDSEIRVAFDVADADKLEVNITKDGNTASYTQLSKGQRQLLKLCYGISVMKAVQNHHGISFNAIFLDEFCEGLSEELKIKTYGLLQQLATEHESVFVVEHSQELKSRFTKRYDVELVNGESVIEQAD